MTENVAFTGHRRSETEPNLELLDRVILNLIKGGAKNFYCGMAVGFDIAAAECVLNFKKTYDINLFACIPCENQAEMLSGGERRRYDRIIENCDGEIVLAPSYFVGCMQLRDRFLVDNADVVVCFLRRKKGGTYYTVNYAASKGIKIIEI